jgi:predicted AAA+ superfamily ATPase
MRVQFPPTMYARCLMERLRRLLGVMPAVYLQGARQTGKTTLAKQLLEAGVLRDYVSFDDPLVRTAAQRDPVGFVRNLPTGTALDEAQLVPEVMPVLKIRIDESRAAGMFLLTGSASPLANAQVADAMVGRMVALQLLPLAQAEIAGSAVNWVAQAFAEPPTSARYPDAADLTARLTRGGYPVAVALDDPAACAEWLRSYADALITRDLQTLGGVERQDAVLTLLRLLAANPCATANIAGLSRETGVAQATLSRYLSLLTNLFVAHPVPAWYANLGKRLLKAPKLMLNDTGLAVALAGFDETQLEREPTYAGKLLENFVGMELLKHIHCGDAQTRLHHLRTDKGIEVDFVLESAQGELVGVEVKWRSTLHAGDFRGLRWLQSAVPERFRLGVVFYTGERSLPMGERLWAIPVSALWSEPL